MNAKRKRHRVGNREGAMSTIDLRAAYEAAKAVYEASRTTENMEAVRAAWAAYDAAAPRRKTSSHASRAGKRQARERRGR